MKIDRTTCVSSGEWKVWRFTIGLATALAIVASWADAADARSAGPVAAKAAESSGASPTLEERITLSPFEVVADTGDTYDATNTNSITGTNLDLNKTPLSAKIFNRTFMDELGVTDVGNMLATFGGLGLPLFGSGSDAQRGMQEGDAVDYKAMTSRGLKISNPRRDGFLRSDVSLADSFDVESAEAVQGSNSLLFGSGDAGGVININSKRARLNQRSLVFAAKWDSEGSLRYTTDINVGAKKFAVRINGMKAKDRYYRPLIMQNQEGLQVAATLKPFHWLSVSGEYRYYLLDHTLAGNATIRTPPTMLLNNGQSMDNMSVRYITGLGGSAALDNFITLRNQDSLSGAFLRHYYTVGSYSAVLAANPLKDLHFQVRYGDDQRTNGNPSPTNQILYHPRAAGNLAPVDASGNRPWAFNTSSTAVARTEGSTGYKVSGSYRRNLGRWGDHWINAFVSRQENTSIGTQYRFVETDASGNIIFQGPLLSANSGQILMPDAWVPAFSETVFGRLWPTDTLVHPQNGKTYRWAKTVYPGTVAPRVGNPLGTSGAIPATGGRPAGYSSEVTHERSKAISLSSEFWRGRINTMAGFRFDNGDYADVALGSAAIPADYHSSTVGVVVDTPVKGIRAYASHSTNALASFGIARNIYDEPLPIGRGITREAGLKFSMFDHRVSGNIAYYVSEAKNFTGTITALDYDRIDPNGVNGRNGGNGFSYNKKSNGLDVALSLRPLKWWQVRLNYTQGDGREGTDVRLPVFYNDEFNTTTANGQTVVGVKNPTSGALTPYMVPSIPGNASSPQIALSVAMLQDRTSPYFAALDRDSGQILNASSLGLLNAGIGTGRTGLAVTNHQLGFVPPADTIIVRKAGERTTGYPENSVSIINRFQVTEGRLRGTVLGFATVYQAGIRGYMYTDAASGGQRKIFFYPDRIENSMFATYSFKPVWKIRPTLQVNISNLFDRQRVIALPNSTTGATRYFAYQYSPMKFSVTTRLSF